MFCRDYCLVGGSARIRDPIHGTCLPLPPQWFRVVIVVSGLLIGLLTGGRPHRAASDCVAVTFAACICSHP